MAMQMRGADPRLYNPDRDMLWAMPRLMQKALTQFGQDITVADVRSLLDQRGIVLDCSDELLYNKLCAVIQSFAMYLNDLKDKPDIRRKPEQIHSKLFTVHKDNRIYAALRSLVADFFLAVVYAELPVWFESVQPEQANNPVPNVGEVEKTVDKLLAGFIHPDKK
jgi:hypothetical protein